MGRHSHRLVKMKKNKNYWIYILECINGNYYTGYSQNLVKRFRQHLDGKANSRYTRSFRPVRIAQCWRFDGTIGTALKIERLIKTMSRKSKENLVANPDQLQKLVEKNLVLNVELQPSDPQQVEYISRKTDSDDLDSVPASNQNQNEN